MHLTVDADEIIKLTILSRSLFSYSSLSPEINVCISKFRDQVSFRVGEYIAGISAEYRKELTAKILEMYRNVVVTSVKLPSYTTDLGKILFGHRCAHFVVHNAVNRGDNVTPREYKGSSNPDHVAVCLVLSLMPKMILVDETATFKLDRNLDYDSSSYDWLFGRVKSGSGI